MKPNLVIGALFFVSITMVVRGYIPQNLDNYVDYLNTFIKSNQYVKSVYASVKIVNLMCDININQAQQQIELVKSAIANYGHDDDRNDVAMFGGRKKDESVTTIKKNILDTAAKFDEAETKLKEILNEFKPDFSFPENLDDCTAYLNAFIQKNIDAKQKFSSDKKFGYLCDCNVHMAQIQLTAAQNAAEEIKLVEELMKKSRQQFKPKRNAEYRVKLSIDSAMHFKQSEVELDRLMKGMGSGSSKSSENATEPSKKAKSK